MRMKRRATSRSRAPAARTRPIHCDIQRSTGEAWCARCGTIRSLPRAICQAVNAIPLTQDLPGLDDLLNLNLPLGLKQALAGANAAPEPTARDLYGGTS